MHFLAGHLSRFFSLNHACLCEAIFFSYAIFSHKIEQCFLCEARDPSVESYTFLEPEDAHRAEWTPNTWRAPYGPKSTCKFGNLIVGGSQYLQLRTSTILGIWRAPSGPRLLPSVPNSLDSPHQGNKCPNLQPPSSHLPRLHPTTPMHPQQIKVPGHHFPWGLNLKGIFLGNCLD